MRREKAPFLSGCESRPATVAPAGSSRSGRWRQRHRLTREPNGTLWFRAALDSTGGHVWFRIAEEAIGRMFPETPAGRGLVNAFIVWITVDRPLQSGINRFEG